MYIYVCVCMKGNRERERECVCVPLESVNEVACVSVTSSLLEKGDERG